MKEITNRCVVNVGGRCNLTCDFCYYAWYDNASFVSTAEIKDAIRRVRCEHGKTHLDLTGGEPTAHADIVALVSFATVLGLETRLITNAVALTKFSLCERLVEAGLRECLISIHGPRPVHDGMSGRSGAFDALLAAVANLQRLSVEISTNTVVTKRNYSCLVETASLLMDINPHACNFIMFNPFESWERRHVKRIAVPNRLAAPYLRDAIDVCRERRVPSTARYLPFCFLPRYESHVCNFAQLSYDRNEWDFNTWIRGERPRTEADFMRVACMLNRVYYRLTPACDQCGVRMICGGVKRALYDLNGSEVVPYSGPPTEEPLFFQSVDPGLSRNT